MKSPTRLGIGNICIAPLSEGLILLEHMFEV